MAFQELQQAIQSLDHVGVSGFEGFVRDLLAEFTGQKFRIMKAGPQGGVDIIGDPIGSTFVIGLEGKHYKPSTPLGLDELKSKLRDAASTFPSMELWLLATTRAISGQDKVALQTEGHQLGVDVEILDWDFGATIPPDLAVLCASASNASKHHLNGGNAVEQDLKSIRAHPNFESLRDDLRARLTSASIGYDATRRFVHQWFQSKMADKTDARVALNSYANLKDPNVHRIPRPAVTAQLDDWWGSSDRPPAVLLGEEGVGKTWAILSWWLSKTAGVSDFPLTLIIPANSVSSPDGSGLMAQRLLDITGLRDLQFWKRRLERWLSSPDNSEMLFVIIDGLNQKWSFNEWSDLILSLSISTFRGKVAFGMTCRPDHWGNKLKQLRDLPQKAAPISVLKLDDTELDNLLQLSGLSRSDFDTSVIELIKIPRLFQMAVNVRDELRGVGDITTERLAFEDWRYRQHYAQQRLSHAEFQIFAAKLGRDIQASLDSHNISRAEILERLEADSGENPSDFQGVLSEIVDGGWLVPDGLNHFQVNPQKIPAVIGLTLNEEIRGLQGYDQISDKIVEVLEPMQNSDLSVSILRYATTFALIDVTVSEDIKQALLYSWLSSQNTRPQDFESFWRLIGCAPKTVAEFAERTWFSRTDTPQLDEFLVKGVANAWRWDSVKGEFIQRLTNWFSCYWLDPLVGAVLGHVPDDETAARRKDNTRNKAKAWALEEPLLNLHLQIRAVDPYHQAWGAARASELMSWLPRNSLILPLTAWAITSAIMGSERQQKYISWVLRWNTEDAEEAEKSVLALAEKLFQGSVVGHAAAKLLLNALATQEAERALAQHGVVREAVDSPSVVMWDVDAALKWGRCLNAPLEAVMAMDCDPTDPSIDLTHDQIQRLEQLADQVTDDQLRISVGNYQAGGLERGRFALSRWAPNRRVELERRIFRVNFPVRDKPKWYESALAFFKLKKLNLPLPVANEGVLERLPKAVAILPDQELELWRSLSKETRENGKWDDRLVLAELYDRSALEQIAILSQRPETTELPDSLKHLLSIPSVAELDSVAQHIGSSTSKERLLFWLDYLDGPTQLHIPAGWPSLRSLITHHDPAVRAAAMELAYVRKDELAAEHLALSGWSWSLELSKPEAAYGSLLLTIAPSGGTVDFSTRVHPEALGFLAEHWPAQQNYLKMFADYIERDLTFLMTAPSISFPHSTFVRTGGWDLLVSNMPEKITEWVQRMEAGNYRHLAFGFFSERFPFLEIISAFDKIEPGARARVMTKIIEDSRSSGIRSGNLYREALYVDGMDKESAWQTVLADANDDQKLFEFAQYLQKNNQTSSLLDIIRENLQGPSAGVIARGITLAAFLDNTPEAQLLWSDDLDKLPASGWLGEVKSKAMRLFLRQGWADHWFEAFDMAQDDGVMFGSIELLGTISDARRTLSDHRPTLDHQLSWTPQRRALWRLCWPESQSSIRTKSDALKQTFLLTELPLANQYPRKR